MRIYEHGGDIYGNRNVLLDFSVNTNPLGMPESVKRALIERTDEYSLYPDPLCRKLRAAISAFEDIDESYILCGNGAADLIYRLCYAVKPRKALVCAPTFSEYELALKQVGCQITRHILYADNGFKLTESISAQITPEIDMLFICTPNNPTGRLVSPDVMESILRIAGQNETLAVIDECFLEFTNGESVKKRINDMSGLVVLKAFTKTFAMAGLRLGYMLTSGKELLRAVNAASQCWSVSVPAQIAGAAAIKCEGWLEKTRTVVARERGFLYESMSALGITVFESDANFLLLLCGRPIYAPLLEKGILIRKCGNFNGLDSSYYRICVKTRDENMRLIQAIGEIMNG